MSSRSFLEAKKRPTPIIVPSRDHGPALRSLFSKQEEPRPVRSLSGHSAFASSGYDFSRIPVHFEERTAGPQRESCPLASAAPPRACPFGGICHTCPVRVQTKPVVSQPGDEYEREADRIADWVMKKDERSHDIPHMVNPKVIDAREISDAPTRVTDVIRTPGRPLDEKTRAFMESRFDMDFSRVRVHTDAVAADSARRLGSLAYTTGPEIFFASGKYETNTCEGRSLLAHELAHVAQQGCILSSTSVASKACVGPTIFRKEGAAPQPADKEQVWGFWVSRSMCGCVPLIKRFVELADATIRASRECSGESIQTGSQFQSCLANRLCGGTCRELAVTPQGDSPDIPSEPADPCEKITHKGVWKVHEVFHSRQDDRIARKVGGDFWKEWQRLKGRKNRVELIRAIKNPDNTPKYADKLAEYDAEYGMASAWREGEIESNTMERQFYYDVLRALKRICTQ